MLPGHAIMELAKNLLFSSQNIPYINKYDICHNIYHMLVNCGVWT